MPTPAERATAILDAVVNGTATASQKQRVLDALGSPNELLQVVRRTIQRRVEQSERAAAQAAIPPMVDVDLGTE